jgi:hypothetical protein
VRPLDVVVPEPGAKGEGATPRVGIRHGIRPPANQGLNESFGLPVGLRMARSATDQPDACAVRDLREDRRHVGAAIVRQDPFDDHASTSKPADGPAQEGGGRPAALIGQDLHIRDTAVVVDGDMGVLVAGPFHNLSAIAMNAMADYGGCGRAA